MHGAATETEHKRRAKAVELAGSSVVELPRPFSLFKRQGAWREALLRRLLALADIVAVLVGSVSLALTASGGVNYALWSAFLVPTWLVIAKVVGLYDRDQRSLRHLTVDELPAIFTWSMVGTIVSALLLGLTPAGQLSAGQALRVLVVVACGGIVFRAAARVAWRKLTPPERAVIVGEGPLAVATRRKLELFPDIHATVVLQRSGLTVEDLRRSGAQFRHVDRILVATSHLDEDLVAALVSFCRERQIRLSVVPPTRGMFGTAVELNHVADLPVMEYNTWDVSRSTLLLKRALDVLVAATALTLLSPVFLLVAAWILLHGGRPILFTQARVGQHGRPFEMLKFRTMVSNAEELLPQLVSFDTLEKPMFKLAGDPRVTWFGRILRRTSIDELPQLINVLRGEMSLVGPRPEQVELVERYSEQDRFRLAVKPGMTGPMQIYGRGQLTFEERLALEREYIESISITRDLRILALTIGPVFSGRGAF